MSTLTATKYWVERHETPYEVSPVVFVHGPGPTLLPVPAAEADPVVLTVATRVFEAPDEATCEADDCVGLSPRPIGFHLVEGMAGEYLTYTAFTVLGDKALCEDCGEEA